MKTKTKALRHYDRMIKWAEKQKPREKITYNDDCEDKMDIELKESFGSEDCAYCHEYNDNCDLCELNHDEGCCDSFHYEMVISKTWGTWVKRAKLVRQYIKDNG